jgi:predicted RNA-binding protein YlxR (DUF448 family)/ribosomal protein L30E
VHRMDSSHTPTRRCLASGASLPQGELVRFIVGPDNQIVPDISGKLPGRGLWVSARRKDVALAGDKNLFSRAAREQVTVPAGLSVLVGSLLRKQCLGLIGLSRKAGDLITGFEKVKSCLGAGQAAVLICAADAGSDGREKLFRFAKDLPKIGVFSSEDLSAALGRENVVHIALKDGGLARRLVQEARRLESYECEDEIAGVSDDSQAQN